MIKFHSNIYWMLNVAQHFSHFIFFLQQPATFHVASTFWRRCFGDGFQDVHLASKNQLQKSYNRPTERQRIYLLATIHVIIFTTTTTTIIIIIINIIITIITTTITHADGSCGGSVLAGVCLSVVHTISQKPMQLGSPNVTQKVPPRVPETHIFWSRKVKVTQKVPALVLSLFWVPASSSYYCLSLLLVDKPRVGPGYLLPAFFPPLPIHFLVFYSFLLFPFFLFSFALPIFFYCPSLPGQEQSPLRFQVGGRRRRSNLGLVFFHSFCIICIAWRFIPVFCYIWFSVIVVFPC